MSLVLLGSFLVAGIIFGSLFWHTQNDSADDLQKSLRNNNPNNASVPPAQSEVATTNTNASTPSQNSPLPTEEKTNSSVNDETANWKEYKDEKNKLSFKYPPEITISSEGNELIFYKEKENMWKLRIYENKQKLNLQDWYMAYFSEKERKNCTLIDSTVKIASYETKYVNHGIDPTICNRDGYFSVGENKTIVLKINLEKETIENINKILATVKF